MNVETKKLELVQKILLTKDEALLEALDQLIQSTEEMQGETGLEASIAAGLEDLKIGNTFANEDVDEYVRKKYRL